MNYVFYLKTNERIKMSQGRGAGVRSANQWTSRSARPNFQTLQKTKEPLPPNANDKSAFPDIRQTMGHTGVPPRSQNQIQTFGEESGRSHVTPKVLRQPANLSPDTGLQFEENNSSQSSWVSVTNRKHRNVKPVTEIAKIQTQNMKTDLHKAKQSPDPLLKKFECQKPFADSKKEKEPSVQLETCSHLSHPAEIQKPELTEAELEVKKALRRERRQREKEYKKKQKEEARRMQMYAPKSDKIQLIDQKILQKVMRGATRDSNRQTTNSNSDGLQRFVLMPSQQNYSRQKEIKFMDEEYPAIIKDTKCSSTVEKKPISVDTSGSEWETDNEENYGVRKNESDSEMTRPSDCPAIVFESVNSPKIESILKKDTADSEKPKKSFASVLATVPDPQMSTRSSSTGHHGLATIHHLQSSMGHASAPTAEVKKVKRKDPITLDLLNVIKATSVKCKTQPKSGVVLGSKLSGQRPNMSTVSSNTRYIKSGNILDSSGPTGRKSGKVRQVPKKKRSSTLKKIILKERKKRKEQRAKTESQLQTQIQMKDESSISVDKSDERKAKIQQQEKIQQKVSTETEQVDLKDLRIKESEAEMELACLTDKRVPPQDSCAVQVNPIFEETPMKKAKRMIHSRKFRDYCDHVLSPELDTCAVQLLEDLVRFQDRQFLKSEIKAKTKRRYVAGLREIKKFIVVKKIVGLIISPDLESVESKGGLNEIIDNLIELSRLNNIPYFFILNRKNLGRSCKRKSPVSAVGILNYQGSETNFHRMLELVVDLKSQYQERLNKALLSVGGTLEPQTISEPAVKLPKPIQSNESIKRIIDLLR